MVLAGAATHSQDGDAASCIVPHQAELAPVLVVNVVRASSEGQGQEISPNPLQSLGTLTCHRARTSLWSIIVSLENTRHKLPPL